METYLIVIGRTATGYSAHCPDVPGCAAVGDTVEATLGNMHGALELHFEGMGEDGEPIPHSGGAATYSEALKELDFDHDILAHVQIDTARFAAPLTAA